MSGKPRVLSGAGKDAIVYVFFFFFFKASSFWGEERLFVCVCVNSHADKVHAQGETCTYTHTHKVMHMLTHIHETRTQKHAGTRCFPNPLGW